MVAAKPRGARAQRAFGRRRRQAAELFRAEGAWRPKAAPLGGRRPPPFAAEGRCRPKADLPNLVRGGCAPSRFTTKGTTNYPLGSMDE